MAPITSRSKDKSRSERNQRINQKDNRGDKLKKGESSTSNTHKKSRNQDSNGNKKVRVHRRASRRAASRADTAQRSLLGDSTSTRSTLSPSRRRVDRSTRNDTRDSRRSPTRHGRAEFTRRDKSPRTRSSRRQRSSSPRHDGSTAHRPTETSRSRISNAASRARHSRQTTSSSDARDTVSNRRDTTQSKSTKTDSDREPPRRRKRTPSPERQSSPIHKSARRQRSPSSSCRSSTPNPVEVVESSPAHFRVVDSTEITQSRSSNIASRTRQKRRLPLPRDKIAGSGLQSTKSNEIGRNRTKSKITKKSTESRINPQVAAQLIRLGQGELLYASNKQMGAVQILGNRQRKENSDRALAAAISRYLRELPGAAEEAEILIRENLDGMSKTGILLFCRRRALKVNSSACLNDLRGQVFQLLSALLPSDSPSPSTVLSESSDLVSTVSTTGSSTSTASSSTSAPILPFTLPDSTVGMPLHVCREVLYRTTVVNQPMTTEERRQLVQSAGDNDFEVDTRLDFGDYLFLNCMDIRDLLDESKTVETTMLSTFQRIIMKKRTDFVFIDPKWYHTATSRTEKNETVRNEKKQEIRDAVTIADGQSPPILLAVCNMRDEHFILIEADTRQRILTHYDSLPNARRQLAELKALAAILDGEQATQRSEYTYAIGECAQQTDTINCGVFSIYNFLCRLHGQQPLNELSADQLMQVRCYVFIKLYDVEYLLSVVLEIRDEDEDLIDPIWLGEFTQQCHERTRRASTTLTITSPVQPQPRRSSSFVPPSPSTPQQPTARSQPDHAKTLINSYGDLNELHSDDDDNAKRPKKAIPYWATKEPLLQAMRVQSAVGDKTFEQVFGKAAPPNISAMFNGRSAPRRRSSEVQWLERE